MGQQVIRQEVGQTPTGQADKQRQVQRQDVSSEGHKVPLSYVKPVEFYFILDPMWVRKR